MKRRSFIQSLAACLTLPAAPALASKRPRWLLGWGPDIAYHVDATPQIDWEFFRNLDYTVRPWTKPRSCRNIPVAAMNRRQRYTCARSLKRYYVYRRRESAIQDAVDTARRAANEISAMKTEFRQ